MSRRHLGRSNDKYVKWGDTKANFKAFHILGEIATSYIRENHSLYATDGPLNRFGKGTLSSRSSTDHLMYPEAPRIISRRGRPRKADVEGTEGENGQRRTRKRYAEEQEPSVDDTARSRRNVGRPKHFDNMVMLDTKRIKGKNDSKNNDDNEEKEGDEEQNAVAEETANNTNSNKGPRKRDRRHSAPPTSTTSNSTLAPLTHPSNTPNPAPAVNTNPASQRAGFQQFLEQLREFFSMIGAWYGVSGPIILHYLREQILPVLRVLSANHLPKDTANTLIYQISRSISSPPISVLFLKLIAVGRGFPLYSAIVHTVKAYDPDNLYGMRSMHYFVEPPPMEVFHIYLRKVVESLNGPEGSETFRLVARLMEEIVTEWKNYDSTLENRLEKIAQIDRLLPENVRGLRARLYHVLMLPTTIMSRTLQQQQDLDEAHVLSNAASMVGPEYAPILAKIGSESLRDTGIVFSGIPNTVLFNNVAFVKPSAVLSVHPAMAAMRGEYDGKYKRGYVNSSASGMNNMNNSMGSVGGVGGLSVNGLSSAMSSAMGGNIGGVGVWGNSSVPSAYIGTGNGGISGGISGASGSSGLRVQGSNVLGELAGHMPLPVGNYGNYPPVPLPLPININTGNSAGISSSAGISAGVATVEGATTGSFAGGTSSGVGSGSTSILFDSTSTSAGGSGSGTEGASGVQAPFDPTHKFLRDAELKVPDQYKQPFTDAMRKLFRSIRENNTPQEEIDARVLLVQSFVPHHEVEFRSDIVRLFRSSAGTAAAAASNGGSSASVDGSGGIDGGMGGCVDGSDVYDESTGSSVAPKRVVNHAENALYDVIDEEGSVGSAEGSADDNNSEHYSSSNSSAYNSAQSGNDSEGEEEVVNDYILSGISGTSGASGVINGVTGGINGVSGVSTGMIGAKSNTTTRSDSDDSNADRDSDEEVDQGREGSAEGSGESSAMDVDAPAPVVDVVAPITTTTNTTSASTSANTTTTLAPPVSYTPVVLPSIQQLQRGAGGSVGSAAASATPQLLLLANLGSSGVVSSIVGKRGRKSTSSIANAAAAAAEKASADTNGAATTSAAVTVDSSTDVNTAVASSATANAVASSNSSAGTTVSSSTAANTDSTTTTAAKTSPVTNSNGNTGTSSTTRPTRGNKSSTPNTSTATATTTSTNSSTNTTTTTKSASNTSTTTNTSTNANTNTSSTTNTSTRTTEPADTIHTGIVFPHIPPFRYPTGTDLPTKHKHKASNTTNTNTTVSDKANLINRAMATAGKVFSTTTNQSVEDKVAQIQKAVAFYFDLNNPNYEIGLALLADTFRVSYPKLMTYMRNEVSSRIENWDSPLTDALTTALHAYTTSINSTTASTSNTNAVTYKGQYNPVVGTTSTGATITTATGASDNGLGVTFTINTGKDSAPQGWVARVIRLKQCAAEHNVEYFHLLLWYARDKVLPTYGTNPSQEMKKQRMKIEEMFTLYYRMQRDGVRENRAALAAKYNIAAGSFTQRLVGLTPEEVQHYTTAAAALTPTQVEVLSRGVYSYNSSGGGGVGGSGEGSGVVGVRRASVGSASVNMDNSTNKATSSRRKSTGTSATASTEGDNIVDSTYWSTDVDAATAGAIAAVATTGANTSTGPSGADGAKRGRGRPKKIVM